MSPLTASPRASLGPTAGGLGPRPSPASVWYPGSLPWDGDTELPQGRQAAPSPWPATGCRVVGRGCCLPWGLPCLQVTGL